MTAYSLAWICWGLAFAAIETAAIIRKDTPTKPRTLSANLRWLAAGAGPLHWTARVVMVALLAWLPGHLGL